MFQTAQLLPVKEGEIYTFSWKERENYKTYVINFKLSYVILNGYTLFIYLKFVLLRSLFTSVVSRNIAYVQSVSHNI
jgi:hypothetical protein